MTPRYSRIRYPRAFAGALAASLVYAATAAATAGPGQPAMGLWSLFQQSFDLFTILLVTGSVVAVAVIISCAIDIRTSKILPKRSLDKIDDLAGGRRWEDLRTFVARDKSFVGRVLDIAFDAGGDRESIREAAELAASEESARWFRKIELLNIIGNLGPLVGLAGTVWGMILAFTSLGETGGQAEASNLSLGISKALFHTLLGLCLAIPCLLFFGLYRSKVDRLCTHGMVICGRLVDHIPADDDPPAPQRTGRKADAAKA